MLVIAENIVTQAEPNTLNKVAHTFDGQSVQAFQRHLVHDDFGNQH